MGLFFNSKNSERMKFVSEIASNFASNPQIKSLWNSSKFEVKIPTRNFSSKEQFVKEATVFLNERGYIIRPHGAGLQGDKNDIYINFAYPPYDAANKEFCYIDVIWTEDYKKYAKQV